ncbi:MAG: hypothetical protein COB53_05935 [Elusimicrobia bacterium]|nr:MAG: hypothetical protein COB53_05935 [Elusimicrobiota bacterium]
MDSEAATTGEITTRDITLPEETVEAWQEIVDILAELLGVPAALITKLSPTHLEIFTTSNSAGNPYKVGTKLSLGGLYCETVIRTKKELMVPNALKDPRGVKNPNIKLGMISYLGYPILWPDGVPFGTICIYDPKENEYGIVYQRFMKQMKALAESHLTTIHLASALASSKFELEETNKDLEAFSRCVSHDLQEPLRAIGNVTLMLEADHASHLDEGGKLEVARIRNNTIHMSELIDDLLEFSRMARHSLLRTDVDMNALAREVYEGLKYHTLNKNAIVQIEHLPPTYGVQSMLRQVFQNLIGNALKFTGKIKEPRITIGGRWEGCSNVYYVQDNGAGFDMKYAKNLFGESESLHKEREFTGTGLAIVRRIVQRHGGKAWAEGEVGKGATMHFSLPNTTEAL